MGIITNWLEYKNDFLNPSGGLSGLFGGGTNSGINVSEDNAMTYSAVCACVRIIAETMVSIPLVTYKTRKDGGKERARDHPNYYLLHDSPNDNMTSWSFISSRTVHMALSGNCYAFKNITPRGRMEKLDPIDWHSMIPYLSDSGLVRYAFWDRGKIETYPKEKVFHVPGFSPDGINGYSPVRLAMEQIAVGMAGDKSAGGFFKDGLLSIGILEYPNNFGGKDGPDMLDRLREQFADRYTGLAQRKKPIVLEDGMKFNRLSIPPNEAQFLESRKFELEEVARIYRMQLHMLQLLDRATFSNIEHQDLGFIKYSMLPWFRGWEQSINMQLFTKQEREEGYFSEFLIDGLLRGDSKSRAEAFHIMRQDGIINADEWREKENMNPQDGEQGKKYLINGNMIEISTIGEKK